ncbi:lipoate--protein ligase family protein [Denitrificimonas caeni]|uniref:Biotin/lipoate A/B protein ligase family protein n=1 Tax=Denitrificimonas caeni TaxID=521720 RepID=A0AAE9VTU3_9GAMM|nr:biotin/lipoate A/B protein ligase family protein [Denitrificimonas caeni]WBE26330.1 biotin/lipoate A/B protein ligase family protein [Denitrificimonas caeni]
MHGEYKVPGGKLVVADVAVQDDCLTQVSISGDFFLEPDTALDLINQALVGLPSTASQQQLAAAVTAALDENVMMFGFSAEAVAIAVRRALGKASSWLDHQFTLIPPVTLPAAMHVALDDVLAQSVAQGVRGPTLRFWDWDDSVVVIGYFQSVKNEVDMVAAKAANVAVVRRITGGGAMFMEPGNCITYSLTVPTSIVDGMSIEQSYKFLDTWVLEALAEVGIKAHYQPLNDIASQQGKIGGAAQKRFGTGVLVHHATLAYDIDADKMLQVLRTGREKLSDKGTTSAKKRVDPMRSQTGLSRDAIIEAFTQHFAQRHQAQTGDYLPEELASAKALVAEKFLTEDWLYKVR